MKFGYFKKLLYLFVLTIFVSACSHNMPNILPNEKNPAQKLVQLNIGMSKAEVVAIMGSADGAGAYPPSFDCLHWVYQNPEHRSLSLSAAVVIFYQGKLVNTSPSELTAGCTDVLRDYRINPLKKSLGL